jgi:subtilisin family serine protease
MRVLRFAHTSVGATVSVLSTARTPCLDRSWAWGSGDGEGVRVCVVDSGVEPHPMVGPLAGSYGVVRTDEDEWIVRAEEAHDAVGHGTACAGIIRSMAPRCELTSLRVVGRNSRGSGEALLAGLRWAVQERFALISVSLSTRRPELKEALRDLSDRAYFAGVTIVSSAHNSPVTSYPWSFPSVISVGSHRYSDPEHIETNPHPPVEFFGAGHRIGVAWAGGTARIASGNSFATPHITGICARIAGQHPGIRATQLRYVLAALSRNVAEEER